MDGDGEGCILLYPSSCGRMKMVRALGYVYATILAQCSALTTTREFGG